MFNATMRCSNHREGVSEQNDHSRRDDRGRRPQKRGLWNEVTGVTFGNGNGTGKRKTPRNEGREAVEEGSGAVGVGVVCGSDRGNDGLRGGVSEQ